MSLKYILKLIYAYLSRFKLIIIFGIFIGIIIFSLFNFLAPKLASGKKTIVGMTGRYRPNELPESILDLISSGLTTFDGTDLKPSLAASWETPDKGKTWIIKLKDDIFWQDKTKVLSSDINFDFTDVSIEAPDEKTIIFTLEKGPYSPFPSVLTKPVFKKGLLGTDKWKVKKINIVGTYVQELTLENEKQILTYKFYPTLDRTLLAYKLGKIDKIVDLFDTEAFNSWKNSTITSEVRYSQVVTLFFNTQDKILSDKSARQALFYAIDKKPLGIRAESPIEPNSWAYNPQLKTYEYDVDNANDLLSDLPDEMRDNMEIKLVSSPNLLPIAEKIASDWEKINVKTNILVSSIIPTDFQAYLAIFEIPKDPDQYPIWHSTQTDTNISKFANPRIDKLLEDGRIELETERRREIYLEFQRFLLEELPAGFLYHPTVYNITRKTFIF